MAHVLYIWLDRNYVIKSKMAAGEKFLILEKEIIISFYYTIIVIIIVI